MWKLPQPVEANKRERQMNAIMVTLKLGVQQENLAKSPKMSFPEFMSSHSLVELEYTALALLVEGVTLQCFKTTCNQI